MTTSDHILADQVVLTADQPLPRVLTLPRGNVQVSRFWSCSQVTLLVLLMSAPLAFGAVESWAWGAITVVAAGLFVLWGLGCVTTRCVRIIWSPLYVPLLALVVLVSVQLRAGHSLDHVATREALFKLLTYAILFFVGQQLYVSASAKSWRITFAAVAIYMFLMAVFAIVQFFASPGMLYGYVAESTSVFGSYVNHGNYAGLVEMLIPMGTALAISLRRKHPAKPFLLFAIFVALVSVFLSGSRAGLISLAIEFAIVALVLGLSRTDQKQFLVVGIVVAVLAVGFFYWLDPGDIWGRWQRMASAPGSAFQDRHQMAIDSLRLTHDHLGYGVGLGAFQTAYTPYQTVVTELTIDYAHNDYLQFVAETGIWGLILAPLSVGIFFVLAFRHLTSRLHQQTGWLQFGAAVGVCGLLVHSLSEFNLHIPANAAWFTFLVALASLPPSQADHRRTTHGRS